MTTNQGYAADGRTPLHNVPGRELLVSAVAFNGAVSEIARLQALVVTLADALEPFSVVLLPFHEDQPDTRVIYSTVDGEKKFTEGKLCITLGDLRRARDAIAAAGR